MKGHFDILYLEPVEKQNPHLVKIELVQQSGRYTLGPPIRPVIKHDLGFLESGKTHEASISDRLMKAKWISMLAGSKALCTGLTGNYIDSCGGDLAEANPAYSHFLFGKGADRDIDYDRFLNNDPAGKPLLKKLFEDFKIHATVIGKDRIKFSITSKTYTVGNDKTCFSIGPETTNWRRTIGNHSIWVSADIVAASSKNRIKFEADIIIHMEDRYNFNPGQADAASGILDQENGSLELARLGQQYMMFGTATRHISWGE